MANTILAKDEQLELAKSSLEIAASIQTYLNANFLTLSHEEFTALRLLQSAINSRAGDIARSAVKDVDTAIADIAKQLREATDKAQQTVKNLEKPKKVIQVLSAFIDMLGGIAGGLMAGGFPGVVSAITAIANFAKASA